MAKEQRAPLEFSVTGSALAQYPVIDLGNWLVSEYVPGGGAVDLRVEGGSGAKLVIGSGPGASGDIFEAVINAEETHVSGDLFVMGDARIGGDAAVTGELALGDWSGSTKASLLFDDALESLFISITDSGGSEDVAQATTSRFDLFVPLSVTGDLSVHKTGGPTLKLSGMAGLQEGRILFEGPGAPDADGAIRYAPDPGLFMIRPDAATSSGQVSIDTGGVHINGDLHVTPDEYLVWHEGNLDLRVFSWTPTLGGSTTNPTTVTYTARVGYYARLGPRLAWVFCHITTSARSGGSGDINITGFPLAITNLSNSTGGVLAVEASSLTYTTAANISVRAHSPGAFRVVQSPSTASWSFVPITNWLANGRITFSGLVLIAPGQ